MEFLNKKAKNRIKDTTENLDQSNPQNRKKLASYLKPILYDHKDMIIKTMKFTKEQQEKAEREAEKEDIKKKL